MNVELKIQVPLAKLSALAAALVAVLGAEGAAQALVVAEPVPPAPTPEVKATKGKKSASAAPADVASSAPPPAAASAPAADSPTPSTSETQSDAGTKQDEELPVYEKTDLGPRIIAVSDTGIAERIAAVKALLGQYQHNGFADKKASSGRHLRREDLKDFDEKFTALEASWTEEAMG